LLDLEQGYARWAPAYPPTAHNPLMQLEEAAMRELLPSVTAAEILDLACGTGRYVRLLYAAGARRVIGVDRSAAMLARAVPGAVYLRAAMEAIPLAPAQVDGIVCGLAVGHVANLDALMVELARVLRPGGWALYSDIHPLGMLAGWSRDFRAADGAHYRLPHHIHLYSDHQRACAAAGLSIEAVAEPRLTGNHPQSGWPAVLVIRARKPIGG
jgi:malonyl-CoA O-methyltransferase